jgi:hypothetical protein
MRIEIALGAPGTLAKKAVVRSVPVMRESIQPPYAPSRNAKAPTSSNTDQYAATSRATAGVKYSPSLVHADIATSGPIIQGKGRSHGRLFADAEAGEDLSEQVVRGELAGNAAQRCMGKA